MESSFRDARRYYPKGRNNFGVVVYLVGRGSMVNPIETPNDSYLFMNFSTVSLVRSDRRLAAG